MMKQRTFIKLVRFSAIMFALIALISAVFSGDSMTAADLGVTTAMAGIAGTVDTPTIKTSTPDLLLDQIEKVMIEISPDRVPLDQLLRHIPDRKVIRSLAVPHYTLDFKAVADQVDGTGTVITASGQTSFELPVKNIDVWAEKDTLFLDGIPAYDSDGDVVAMGDLELYVYGIDRGNNKLKVQPVNGVIASGKSTLVTGDDIAADVLIRRGGRAGQEEDMQTTPYADMPEKDFNYMQKFMAQIEETTWASIHAKEIDYDFSDFTRRQLTNLRIDKETSYLNGFKAMINSIENGKPVYLTGGARQYVTNMTDWSGVTLTNKSWQSLCREVFSGNGGSSQRVLLAGDYLLQQIGEIDDVQAQTSAKNRETKFGLTFNRVATNWGDILIMRAPLFGLQGMGHMGLILDLSNLAERHFEPLRTVDLDLQKSGQKDAKSKVLIETSCPLFRYPDTHRWLKGTIPS